MKTEKTVLVCENDGLYLTLRNDQTKTQNAKDKKTMNLSFESYISQENIISDLISTVRDLQLDVQALRSALLKTQETRSGKGYKDLQSTTQLHNKLTYRLI